MLCVNIKNSVISGHLILLTITMVIRIGYETIPIAFGSEVKQLNAYLNFKSNFVFISGYRIKF